MNFDKLGEGTYILKLELYDGEGRLVDSGYSVHSSGYELPYRELVKCKTNIETTLSGNALLLKNNGKFAAVGLTVECDITDDFMFSDGAMLLLPAESRTVEITSSSGTCEIGNLYISALGVPYSKI